MIEKVVQYRLAPLPLEIVTMCFQSLDFTVLGIEKAHNELSVDTH